MHISGTVCCMIQNFGGKNFGEFEKLQEIFQISCQKFSFKEVASYVCN